MHSFVCGSFSTSTTTFNEGPGDTIIGDRNIFNLRGADMKTTGDMKTQIQVPMQ